MNAAGFRRPLRSAVGGCLTLLVVLLPALAAGSRLAAPPTAGELARLQAALATSQQPGVGSLVARAFCVSTVGGGVTGMPDDADERSALTSRARLAQVASVLGVSLVLYLALLLARGRVQALLGCAALGVLPAIAVEGHVLRPEAPATLFAGLAVVLLQCLARPPRVLARRGGWRSAVQLVGLSVCAATALGLSVATLPSLGECLLVPGIVLTLAALQLGVRGTRIARRAGFFRLPVRAINRRLLPWTATALLAPIAALLWLSCAVLGPVEAIPVTASRVSLLPHAVLASIAAGVLLGLGALGGVLRVGLRLGRGGRVGADVVLLVFCGVHLAAALGAPEGTDSLPAAPAMAAVQSEGALLLAGLVRWGGGILGGRARRSPR